MNLLRLRKQRPLKERVGFKGAGHDGLTQSFSTPRLVSVLFNAHLFVIAMSFVRGWMIVGVAV